MSRDPILVIDKEKFLGRGSFRAVYLHPQDPGKVLKVFHGGPSAETGRARRGFKALRTSKKFDQNRQDYAQHRRLERKGLLTSCVYGMYGIVETDMGPALVAEYVRNGDGRSSPTLWDYVSAHGIDAVRPLIEELFETLARHHVVLREPHHKNIVVREKQDGSVDLVVIDGLGDPNIVPFATLSKHLNRRKLMRKKGKLYGRLERLLERPAG
ncbi:MAG: YrbL family protein [Alphaproteobacteria bacterium]|nr:YrbL family protein [Alphaproteobacteria bacterium]